jgi:type IV secretion system protein VirB6
MYLLKFALVLYFSTAGAWYYVQEDEAYGLFPTLIWGADEIADLFLGAQNDNDPRGLCRYKILGDQLLAQRNIDPGSIGSGVVATVGSTKLKMTVWDLVDCKVVNYINLGSCHYTLGGLIGAWFVGAAFFVGGNGILLAIVSFLYCFMLLLVIFRFTHIFVLSAFMIAILVLVCPIFLCFALFEATKSIFDSWMKMLLGYILYPALLFAFVALMLMTFDSVFYGDLNVDFDPNVPITEACEGIHSAYCITVKAIEKDPCLVNGGYFGEAMTDQIDLGLLGSYTVLKGSVVNDYLSVVVRLMLFALLYYLFVGAVTNFLAVLTQVQDLNSMAKGDINLTAPIKKLASMAGGLASAGVSKAVGAAAGVVDKISSKT